MAGAGGQAVDQVDKWLSSRRSLGGRRSSCSIRGNDDDDDADDGGGASEVDDPAAPVEARGKISLQARRRGVSVEHAPRPVPGKAHARGPRARRDAGHILRARRVEAAAGIWQWSFPGPVTAAVCIPEPDGAGQRLSRPA